MLMAILLGSCGPNYSFKETKDIPEKGWSYQNKLSFDFEVNDTSQLHDLFIQIEHKETFSTQNIYVNVYTGMKGEALKKNEISLELFSKLGLPIGSCRNELCKTLIPIQTSTFFDKVGTYVFEIEQNNRANPLRDIQSVTFLIQKGGTK
mgnify:CR=1 FL=1